MIELSNLSLSYGSNLVIEVENLKLESGFFYSIVGVNGSGKTTLLKSIVNLIDYSGNILLDNKEVKKFKRSELVKEISYFRQNRNVLSNHKVYDVIMLSRYAYMKGLFRQPSKRDIEVVENLIAKLDLEKLRNEPIINLSGGERQRVFLAKALATEPKVLLLDEPTNHLDLKYQIEIIDYIKEWLIDNKTTVIAVLHDLNVAINYADKLILLNNKKSYLFHSKDDLLRSTMLDKAYNLNI